MVIDDLLTEIKELNVVDSEGLIKDIKQYHKDLIVYAKGDELKKKQKAIAKTHHIKKSDNIVKLWFTYVRTLSPDNFSYEQFYDR